MEEYVAWDFRCRQKLVKTPTHGLGTWQLVKKVKGRRNGVDGSVKNGNMEINIDSASL